MLRIIFQKEFGSLKVIAQKVYFGSDTDKHGARLDLYLEETEQDEAKSLGAIYDVEPNLNGNWEAIRSFPRRVRFYHAQIDANSLKAGDQYPSLKNVFIILITPYDPFGMNRMLYTIKRSCVEEPLMPYEDGARTLFLYTKGTEGNPPGELVQLLRYMEKTTEENAVSQELKKLHYMVETVKRDKEVALDYMKVFEREQMLREEGRAEERINTEREHSRAVAAEEEACALREEIEKLKSQIKQGAAPSGKN